MSTHTRKACLKCRAIGKDSTGDHLIVGDDGHEFCFIHGLIKGRTQRPRDTYTPVPILGDSEVTGLSLDLSLEGKVYLYQFRFIDNEIQDNHIQYIDIGWYKNPKYDKPKFIKHCLYFPCIDGFVLRNIDGTMRMKNIKSHSPLVWHSPHVSDILVLTEDIPSAIVVHRSGVDTIALLGTKMNDKINAYLIKHLHKYKKIIIWLDNDASGKSCAKLYKRWLINSLEVSNIATEKDPKYYSNNEVREFLGI